jgi:hypothetical protein
MPDGFKAVHLSGYVVDAYFAGMHTAYLIASSCTLHVLLSTEKGSMQVSGRKCCINLGWLTVIDTGRPAQSSTPCSRLRPFTVTPAAPDLGGGGLASGSTTRLSQSGLLMGPVMPSCCEPMVGPRAVPCGQVPGG